MKNLKIQNYRESGSQLELSQQRTGSHILCYFLRALHKCEWAMSQCHNHRVDPHPRKSDEKVQKNRKRRSASGASPGPREVPERWRVASPSLHQTKDISKLGSRVYKVDGLYRSLARCLPCLTPTPRLQRTWLAAFFCFKSAAQKENIARLGSPI